MDDTIAYHFAQAAIAIQDGHPAADLIGSHGQTVYHRPPRGERREERGERGEESGDVGAGEAEGVEGVEEAREDVQDLELKPLPPFPPSPFPLPSHSLGYSLQLGRGATIAHATGIPTVSNFRAADIAAGGHGAPLVPAVDVALLSHPTNSRCIQNIGGIGNVAYLPARKERQEAMVGGQKAEGRGQRAEGSISPHTPHPTPHTPHPTPPLGWDTGPGNVLIDLAVHHFSHGTQTYDRNGAWAASGTPCSELVAQWLQQPFFQLLPPKSTGRELYSEAYLEQCLADARDRALSEADILATLTDFTAASIAHSYRTFLPQLPDQVLLCGGGSKNLYLKQRLQQQLGTIPVLTTDDAGLNAEFKEAIAFAVLAYWRQHGVPGNLPAVTGAASAVLLGEINQVSRRGA
ncbi:MAG: anhydro-N-acetylmuramic acid kinase [Lyngbya sp. HA4199-MV5]|nr:anhydro-N-acetylmuramic acid kinase [Lyngbya sp. HA4199-MV5]